MASKSKKHKAQFPKTLYVGVNTDDGVPMFIAHGDEDDALDASEDGERIAVYQLIEVRAVDVQRALIPAGKKGR